MSEAALRSYIVSLVESVSGIGVVHDYERWAAQWSDLLALYKTNNVLNGWYVTRRRTEAQWEAMPVIRRRHEFEVCGIYSLDDSAGSEKTFQALIEAIDAAVRFDHSLGGNAIIAGPLQVEEVEARMFGSVLCHYCRLLLPAEEREYAT